MSDTVKPFLKKGLNVYADAQATLKIFEQRIGELLVVAVKRRKRWLPLKNHQIDDSAKAGKGRSGYWVAMNIKGVSPREEEVMIDCGFWWNAPEGDGPIIYAGFEGFPKRVLKFSWGKQRQGISSFDTPWRTTYLYMPAPKSLNITSSLNRLLDELLKQLK